MPKPGQVMGQPHHNFPSHYSNSNGSVSTTSNGSTQHNSLNGTELTKSVLLNSSAGTIVLLRQDEDITPQGQTIVRTGNFG